jgi:hypothetical protein
MNRTQLLASLIATGLAATLMTRGCQAPSSVPTAPTRARSTESRRPSKDARGEAPAAPSHRALSAPEAPAGPAKPVDTSPEQWTHAQDEVAPAPGQKICACFEVCSLDELCSLSDRIAIGRVISKKVDWNEDHSAITTTYRFAVETPVKGPAEREIELRVVGGQLEGEDLRLEVTHMPKLAVGERGIVFVSNDPRLWTSIFANRQGFLSLEALAPGRDGIRDGFGRPIYGLDAGSDFIVEGLAGQRMELKALLKAIQHRAG